MNEYWELNEGKVDSATFFEALAKYFPEATTLYIEGTSISEDVRTCYLSHQEAGPYLPPAQTIFPLSKKYRCKFSDALMGQLVLLAAQHAEPELLDHISLYQDSEELLLWHDAFTNVMLVSRGIPEKLVAQFAADLGLKYQYA